MKIAIIGAGWAGLAAAHHIHTQGFNVDIYEASHTLGGRARTVYNSKLGCNLDNGQHILLGAYSQTLSLMQKLGLNPDELFIRKPLHIESTDGSFCIKLKDTNSRPNQPTNFKSKFSKLFSSDLVFLQGLITAKGISYEEKLNMALTIRKLKNQNWQIDDTRTTYSWLKAHKQSANIINNFWQPLCIAALNTPIEKACTQLFANVLRDSIGSKPSNSDILIAKNSLSELWPNQLLAIANESKNQTNKDLSTSKLNIYNGKNIYDLTEIKASYDAVILACNVSSSIKLLTSINDGCTEQSSFINNLKKFEFNPISTVSLQLKEAWNLPESMYMLHEKRDLGFYGQWLFTNIPAFPNIANIVISDADAAIQNTPAELTELIIKQLQQQTQRFGAMPKVIDYQVITEKRATFYSYPNLWRPSEITPWNNVFIAGDFTDTGYPAVLEGAVRSGIQAAGYCLDNIRRFA